MPFYHFLALNHQRKTETGMQLAPSVDVLSRRLKHTQLMPLSIKRMWRLSGKFNDIDRYDICIALAELLRSGVPLTESLAALAQDQRSLKRRIVCMTFYDLIQSGAGMQAFNQPDFFDEMAINALLNAQHTGHLDRVFQRLSEYYMARAQQRADMHNLLRYPIFLGITLCVLMWILCECVMPNIEMLVPTAKRGFAYESFKWSSEHILMIGVAIVITSIALFFVRSVFYRIPQIARIAMCPFWRVMAFCLEHHLSIIQSLRCGQSSLPVCFSLSVDRAIADLNEGQSIHIAFQNLPASTYARTSMIMLAQKTGNISDMVSRYALMEEDFVKHLTRQILSWMQPLLLIIMGLMVIWVLQATIGPLYDSLSDMSGA